MALSNYVVPRTEVKIDEKNSISVRALSLEDVSFLVSVHKEDVDTLIEKFSERFADKKAVDPDEIDKAVREGGDDMISAFLQQFPLLAANVISVACDEPEAWQNARRLPLPVQVEALLAIARLTFEDAAGFKKFVGNAVAVLRSASPQAPQISKSKKRSKSTGSTG